MPEPYILTLMGGLSLAGPDGPLKGPVVQHRRLALLALLAAARGRPVSRDKLIATLWPTSPTDRARHSLSDALHVLHKVLGERAIVTARDELWLDPEVVANDVAAFEVAVESGALERAVELYGGPFLDGFFVSGTVEFDNWAAAERERLERVYAGVLERLAMEAAGRGDPGTAAGWWMQRSALDPYDARVAVRFMEALASAGDRAGAIQHAVAHAALLHRELDAEADPVVTDLARRLRQEPLAWAPSEAVSPPSAAERSQTSFPTSPTRRIPRWVPKLTRRHAMMVGSASLAVAVVVLGIVVARRGGADSQEARVVAAPGIAVLPFTVQGEGLEVMREGMVSLLSTGLDGAGGLRTIAPATVFARSREQVLGEETPELPIALEIARRTGARYALLGSAVSIGSTMRVVATVYDVNTGRRLGQGQVEGSPDNMLPLVDRLGVEVLRIILQRGEEELPEIDMASLTTENPEALKAYLEGEVHLRHFEIEAAQDAYTQAVDADSMFALAHTRLAQAYWWVPQNLILGPRHLTRAAQLVGRLSAREALLVRARRAIWWRTVDELGALRESVQSYPDDAEMWYLLGETLLHLQGAMAPAEEVEAVFERAMQLDPGNAEYLYHYTQLAWTVHADSQEAVRRVEMFERAGAERSVQSRAFRLALDLGFGDSAAQASALARLASEDSEMLSEVGVTLTHPRYEQNLAVTRMRFQRPDGNEFDEATVRLAFTTLSYNGRFRELLDLLEDPRIDPGHRAYSLYAIRTLGFPVPVESLDESIGSIAIDSIAEPWVIVNVGLYTADQARWSDHQRVIAELERRRTLALVQGDSLSARDSKLLADFVQGYGLWRRNGPEAALPILAAPDQQEHGWWIGKLYQKLGRFREAERTYQTFRYPRGRYMPTSIHPLTYRELGKVYEALGEYDKAREAYEYFVEYWRDADPEMQPMVEEARQAIIRLEQLRIGFWSG